MQSYTVMNKQQIFKQILIFKKKALKDKELPTLHQFDLF
jgi:hypothetical protein